MENYKTRFRPILFSTPMVQALLEGRKTMTRRTKGLEKVNENPSDWSFCSTSTDETRTFFHFRKPEDDQIKQIFGTSNFKVGDVLWVRETFRSTYTVDVNDNEQILYKANEGDEEILKEFGWKWKPSIFMPKYNSRIFLRIKSIRVERLQYISEEDAKTEGVLFDDQFKKYNCYLCSSGGHVGAVAMCEDGFFSTAKESFRTLWKSINGQSSWHCNPYVFVYEFEKTEKPLDF